MASQIIQLLKENLLERKRNISDFLKSASSQTVHTRLGSADKQSMEEQLHQFDALLQKAENDKLGRCEVCSDFVDASRLEMDYTACVCLEHLSNEDRTRLENDLELSQKVQQALLPQALPRIQSLDVAVFSQPAHIVGGDYFDFLRFKDGSHALAIADVMGKGMSASMLMANLQASLRIITPESTEPSEVLARLNQLFCHNIRLTKFVTFFLARFDEASRLLTFCNAGHNPPILRRFDGSIERLLPTGAAIGLIEQSKFHQSTIKLHQGDRIMMYTDGVVETFNPEKELFGEERLTDFLHTMTHVQGSQVISSLKNTLQQYSHSLAPADDTTIIVISAL
jgi:phosphoserine phosphatase RsbU/P